MADEGLVVEGAVELDRTLHKLADDLDDLTPADQKAADVLLELAGPHTPRDTGALAASGHVVVDDTGGTVVYDEVYAGVIHYGWPDHNIDPQPWLEHAAEEHTTDLTDVYIDHLTGLVHQVRGI